MVSNEVEALAVGRVVRGAPADAEGADRRADGRLAPRRGRLPAPHRARGRRASRARAAPVALRGEVRDRARGAPLGRRARTDEPVEPTRARPAEPRLRRPGRRAARRRAARGRRADRGGRARAPADPRPHAAPRPRARRPRDAGRGRPRGARDQLHEGLLPGPGAGRAAPLPRPPEPRPPRRRARRRRASRLRRRARRSTARSSGGSRAPRPDPEHGIVALAYVRREVPPEADLGLAAGPRASSSSTSLLQASPLHSPLPRARSSGDRALPCGGRGRKFESCRAHGAGEPMVSPPTPSFRVATS